MRTTEIVVPPEECSTTGPATARPPTPRAAYPLGPPSECVDSALLEADDLHIRHRDRREPHRYRDKDSNNAAYDPEQIDQEYQELEHAEAEIVVLHHRVARLHRRPEVHPLVHNEQVCEFVHGRYHQAGDDAQTKS